jgi:hypothetical protein
VIETDSDNELELVTPPFFLRTAADGVPLPDWKEVRAFEEMMTSNLLQPMNDDAACATTCSTPKKLPDLIAMLQTAGIPFQPLKDVDIEATQLTHRTPTVTDKILAADVAKVCLQSAPKTVLIGHQVNFATDALTFTALKYVTRVATRKKDLKGTDDYRWVSLWLQVLDVMKKSPSLPTNMKPSMKAFLLEYAAVISNQVALPAMSDYLAYAKKLYASPATALKDAKDDKLENYEGLGSYVKDWSRFWLKSSIYNLGRGLLDKEEWNAVLAFNANGGELETSLKKAIDNDTLGEFYTRAAAVRARTAIEKVPGLLITRFFGQENGPLDDEFEVGRRTQIFEHDEKHIGPRQDTYVGASKVQLAAWPNSLLFVVEDREDAPFIEPGGTPPVDDAGDALPESSMQRLGDQLAASTAPRKIIEDDVDALWNLTNVTLPGKELEKVGGNQ